MIAGRTGRPRGVTLVEVVVVIFMIAVAGMLALMAIPRSRDSARLDSCNRNLAEIGKALNQFDGASGHLPRLPGVGEPGDAPLATLARQFGLERFEDAPKSKAEAPFLVRRVRGFVCPADPSFARLDRSLAPVSYRAAAGPGTDGTGGPFTFGGARSLHDAESAAGQDFTAGFAERLLGSGSGPGSPENDYRAVVGPVGSEPCAEGPWRTDAGSSWAECNWRSTLYNHSLRPDESPSCIAADGKTARMGASSAHPNRVNVLMLGGSVRGFTPGVDRSVWRKFGAIDAEGRTPPAR